MANNNLGNSYASPPGPPGAPQAKFQPLSTSVSQQPGQPGQPVAFAYPYSNPQNLSASVAYYSPYPNPYAAYPAYPGYPPPNATPYYSPTPGYGQPVAGTTTTTTGLASSVHTGGLASSIAAQPAAAPSPQPGMYYYAYPAAAYPAAAYPAAPAAAAPSPFAMSVSQHSAQPQPQTQPQAQPPLATSQPHQPMTGSVKTNSSPGQPASEDEARIQAEVEARMRQEQEKMRASIEADIRQKKLGASSSSGLLAGSANNNANALNLQHSTSSHTVSSLSAAHNAAIGAYITPVQAGGQLDPDDAEYLQRERDRQLKAEAEMAKRRAERAQKEMNMRQSVMASKKSSLGNTLAQQRVGAQTQASTLSASRTPQANYFNRTVKALRQSGTVPPTTTTGTGSSRGSGQGAGARVDEETRLKREQERLIQQAIDKFKQEELERMRLQVVDSFRQEEAERIRHEMESQFEKEKQDKLRRYEEDRRARDKGARWEIEPADVQLGKLLGKGAFGEVFRAKLHGKDVAVKKLTAQDLDEEVLADFRREVDIMLNLHHPNILLFMGACTRTGQLMIVTEFMPRGSVDDLIHNAQLDLPLQKRLQFGKECALGMNWLHSLKPIFLHLDLKPANLLVDYNWTVKVADFGMSQVKTAGEGAGGVVGSPFYMAPEILLEKDFDEKVDVYSFGVVLWELVTRLEPYEGRFHNFDELIDGVGIERVRPRIPNDCQFQLKNVITQCWDHDPVKRPSFESICQSNTFDNIIVHMTILEHSARDFWKKFYLEKNEVPFKQFWAAWREEFQLKESDVSDNDVRVRCFKELLSSRVDPDKVFMENINDAFYWFGPLERSAAGAIKCLEKMAYLMSQKWFHGDLGQEEAERLLNRQKRGVLIFTKDDGFWLVRFGKNGFFYFSVKTANKTFTHMEIKNSSGVLKIGGKHFTNWEDILQHARKELKISLQNFVYSTRYESIFPGEVGRPVVPWQ